MIEKPEPALPGEDLIVEEIKPKKKKRSRARTIFLCAKALRIYENERCQKKCQTANTHTYKKGRCVKRLRTTLDIDEEV